MGRRSTAIPNLAAALKSYRDWKVDAKLPTQNGDDGELDYADCLVDYTTEFVWFDPAGQERGVTEEQLEQRDGEWPLPGRYEIRVFDSRGELVVHWEAEHVTLESLARRNNGAESLADAVGTLAHSFETQIRNSDYRREKAEKAAETAREKQRVAEERLQKEQSEKAKALLQAERALADRDIAEARQKELQEAYNQLEEDVSMWKPHLQMMVDHGMDRFGEMLFGFKPRNSNGADNGPVPEDWDKPPPDLMDPESIDQELFGMFFDLDRLQALVEREIVSWPLVRSIIWHKTKRDLGGSPQWEKWRAERDASAEQAQEPQAAE